MSDTVVMSDQVKAVIGIAAKAAMIVSKHYKQQLDVTIKDGDEFNFVTQADKEADAYIRTALAAAFPDDQILSEEYDARPSSYAGRVWMVDPLDGTKDFINGGHHFSVMIGLCDAGRPVLGCVVRPTDNAIYWGEKNTGAYEFLKDGTNKRLQANTIAELAEAKIVVSKLYGEPRPGEEFLHKLPVKEVEMGGSFGLRAAGIALGEIEFFVNTNMRASKWDICAPQAIIEAAGGKVTDVDGKPLNYSNEDLRWETSFVGSNGVLHEKVIAALTGIKQLL